MVNLFMLQIPGKALRLQALTALPMHLISEAEQEYLNKKKEHNFALSFIF
jgi:hypothetical protein